MRHYIYDNINNMELEEYSRKPGDVKAVQIDEEFSVSTLEGNLIAKAGSYLVFGDKNDVWPVDEEIFNDRYYKKSNAFLSNAQISVHMCPISFANLDPGLGFSFHSDGVADFVKLDDSTFRRSNIRLSPSLVQEDNNIYKIDQPYRNVYAPVVVESHKEVINTRFSELPVGTRFSFTSNGWYEYTKLSETEYEYYAYPAGDTIEECRRPPIPMAAKAEPDQEVTYVVWKTK